jgi:hypothetical protein
MIYSLVGTDRIIREKARVELARLGQVTRRLYAEDVSDLEPLIDISSLFGDTSIVECVQMFDNASAKEKIQNLLEEMNESQTIFIIDEPFADANRTNKLAKFSGKLYDAREEKSKDVEVFTLVDYFIKRDKKNAWVTWLRLKEKMEGEAIQGALWWKFTQMWQVTLEGGKTAFSKEECELFGGKLLRSVVLAHKGEKDLDEELEKLILSL